jgi:Bacterial PH domain
LLGSESLGIHKRTTYSMAAPRYLIPQHPSLSGPHTKDDLYVLVERGSLGRGEIVMDRISGRSHRVGDLLSGMRPPRAAEPDAPSKRPSYQEFNGDTPWEMAGSSRKLDEEESLDDEDAEYDEFSEIEEGELGYDEEEGDDYELEEEDGEEDDEPAEIIVFRGHPSWFSFFKALLLALLLLFAAVGSIQFGGLKWLLLGVSLSSLTFCCVIIARQHRYYIVTNERVECVWGLIGRSSKEVRIRDIRSIDVIENGLLGFLGIGSVDFSSASTDGIEVQFRNIRRPHRVKELVRQWQKRVS